MLVEANEYELLTAPRDCKKNCVFAPVERVGLEDVIKAFQKRQCLYLLAPLSKPKPEMIWLEANSPIPYGNVGLHAPGCLASSLPDFMEATNSHPGQVMTAREINEALSEKDIDLKDYAKLLRRLLEKRIYVHHYVPLNNDRVSVTG